ncbi:MAG: MFS transporter, partial [Pseudomonadota bacterium]|nr:MFS transporter [Pseudomonadota bacterium]
FVEWAWRIPFFISGLLVIVGFWTRRRVEESPAFLAYAQQSHEVERAPLKQALLHNRVEMLQAFFVKAAENTYLYMFTTLVLLLATSFLKVPRQEALTALLWASAFEVLVVIAAAYVSDRIGRRPVLLVGFVSAAIASYGLFTLEPGALYGQLQIAVLACLSCHGIILGAMAAYMAELFPTKVRYTALSTSYQFASVFGGSIAPLIGTVLLQTTGASVTVALYATVVAVPALISIYLSRESRGVDFFGPESLEAVMGGVPER